MQKVKTTRIRLANSQPSPRCRGCGKVVVGTHDCVRVALGTIQSSDSSRFPLEFVGRDDEVWGYMHQVCFLTAIGDSHGIELMMQQASGANA